MKRTAQYFSRSTKKYNQFEGFTLIELLVVIAIIAILAVVGYLMLNPIELQKQARDGNRLTDLATLTNAINVSVTQATGSTQYQLCGGVQANCGQTYTTANATAATRKPDGTGWVKVDVSSSTTNAASLPILPVDPINVAPLIYTYSTNAAGTSYEIDAQMESQKQANTPKNDGGNNDSYYEVGSDLTVLP